MAPSTDRMTILEAAQAQQKATPAQAAVIMLFMLEFILRSIIVAASFRFRNVGPILAKPSADVNGHSAQIGIKLHKRPLYRLCILHKNGVKFANNWKFFGPATGEKGREIAAGKASLSGDEGAVFRPQKSGREGEFVGGRWRRRTEKRHCWQNVRQCRTQILAFFAIFCKIYSGQQHRTSKKA